MKFNKVQLEDIRVFNPNLVSMEMIERVIEQFHQLEYPMPRTGNAESLQAKLALDRLIAQLILDKDEVDAEVELLVEQAQHELLGWLGWAEP